MFRKLILLLFLCLLLPFISGCALTKEALSTTGKVAGAVGKIALAAGKVTAEVVKTTGKVVTTVVELPGRRRVVKLTRRGNTLLVKAVLNRKVKANLILDTGCSETQLSGSIASRLGIQQGYSTLCTLANGSVVSGAIAILREIAVGKARVRNVSVIVLNAEGTAGSDGLLGMSFLNNFVFKIDAQKQELILEKRK